MYKEILEPVTDGIGLVLTGATVTMSILEVLSSVYINDGLHMLATIGALVFLYYKIKNSRLDAKLKEQNLNKPNKTKEDEA